MLKFHIYWSVTTERPN